MEPRPKNYQLPLQLPEARCSSQVPAQKICPLDLARTVLEHLHPQLALLVELRSLAQVLKPTCCQLRRAVSQHSAVQQALLMELRALAQVLKPTRCQLRRAVSQHSTVQQALLMDHRALARVLMRFRCQLRRAVSQHSVVQQGRTRACLRSIWLEASTKSCHSQCFVRQRLMSAHRRTNLPQKQLEAST